MNAAEPRVASVSTLRAIAGAWLEHKGRVAVSVLAIALGVALGYAVQLINQVAVSEFAQAVQTLSGEADLVIRGAQAGFDERLYAGIAADSQVAVASPVVEVDARVVGQDELLKIVGIDVFRAGLIQPGLVGEGGEALDTLRDDVIFLNAYAADWLQAAPGDTVAVQVGLGEVKLRVAGSVRAEGYRLPLAVMDIAGAQRRFEWLGRLARIDVRLRPGADVEVFRKRVSEGLPPGVVIERPRASVESGARLSRSYRVNLNVLALVALFTGGLLVFSAQALAVVRRRPYIALLRVLGMKRSTVLRGLLVEAGVIGAVGAGIGILLGYALAQFVLRVLGPDLGSGFFRGLEARLTAEPVAAVVFFALGIAVAVLGSLAAAREAARADPAPALKAGDEQRAFARLERVAPGMALVAAGALATLAPALGGLPIFGYVSIALVLIGTILLIPRIARVVFRALPIPRTPSMAFALLQLRGAPGQATVSLASIVASVSLLVAMAIMVGSFRVSLDAWLGRVLPADLYVRAGAWSDTGYLSRETQRALRSLPGVARVDLVRREQILLDPARPRIVLLARELDEKDPTRGLPLVGPPRLPETGDPPELWASEIAADLYGFSTGRVVELPLAGRNVRFRIAGVWRDYGRQQGALVMDRDRYIALTGDRKANDGGLFLAPGASRETLARLITQRVPGGDRLEITLPAEIRSRSLRAFDRTFAVTYALEAVALLIGLMGLSASFGSLVLTRRREFGMLRHVGVTRGQIGMMLATEGAVVSALGLAVGSAVGWVISLILIDVVNRQSFHWGMDLHVPWLPLAAFTVVMLALASVTAVASGRQAMSGEAVRSVKEDW
ncbi:MAG: FtsX-like permease family protein [Betaproteobacteria bacterium]|jgi:putative ABC transport system permease protein|nr:FtsX-like permease family protein [Betaproteobacteria bacterium]